ncbi:hypothetical protein CRG98_036484 [Punica granatum]|uniref:Uncharacterized protein n=1 Tax=Punica granatum TaxID=22663 RepID=A0A2I0IGF8_PUNGR|nr:hypothetical protein CRG98_036484 [Punica granatum]
MVVKDDWVRAAITDDTVVVELLVRLKQARASAPIKTVAAPVRAAVAELPPPRWGIRQPRTRLAFRCDTASPVKGGDSRRNSPTTPLSWSAGTASSSGTADGYEESDLPACGSSRSKVQSDFRSPELPGVRFGEHHCRSDSSTGGRFFQPPL